MTRRVRSALDQARGTWVVQAVDTDDAQRLEEGWEPFGVDAGRIYVRRRQRDLGRATLLVAVAIGLLVLARWVLLLLLALFLSRVAA